LSITESFQSIVPSLNHIQKPDDTTDVQEALCALCGCFMHSPTACQQAFSTTLCETLVSFYQNIQLSSLQKHPHHTITFLNRDTYPSCILCILSHLFVQGYILPLKHQTSLSDPDELLQSLMEIILHCFAPYDSQSVCLGDLLFHQQKEKQKSQLILGERGSWSLTLVEAIIESFPYDSPQRDYLIQQIESSPTSRNSSVHVNTTVDAAKRSFADPPPPASSTEKYASSIERHMDQIHTILPHLGLGYIQVALSCYHNDPEQTLAMLLEGEMNPSILHPRLQNLDIHLPVAKKNASESPSFMDDVDEEARKILKKHVQATDAQSERDAYQLQLVMTTDNNINHHRRDEYDDDYDDQYDDVGEDAVGGADTGMYDVDYDAIRTYNRITRAIESEDAFWNDIQNTNRQTTTNASTMAIKAGEEDTTSDEKLYRGPDKGKGGRILGPDGRYVTATSKKSHPQKDPIKVAVATQNPEEKSQKKMASGNTTKTEIQGASKDEQQQTSDHDMTKLDKRRKNTQQTHHHRKDRATRKANQGMI
jgi:hypothetical protein